MDTVAITSTRRTAGALGSAVALLGLLLMSEGLAAQARMGAPTDDERPDGRRVMCGTRTYRMEMVRDGQRRRMGEYVVSVRKTFGDGAGGAWLLVQETDLPNGKGSIVDSIWMEPETLFPERRVTHSPDEDLTLEYEELGVHGERRTGDGSTKTIRESFRRRAYSASAINLLLQGLRLRRGFRTTLPAFVDGQGLAPVKVAVTGSDVVELPDGRAVPVWVLDVTVDTRLATLWVSKETGIEIRTRSELPSGGHFEQSLVESQGGQLSP